MAKKEWLVSKWDAYIKLNFELRKPGARKAVEELRKMVDSHRTLDFSPSRKNGYKGRPIASRRLRHFEFVKLRRLLPIYEEKLKALREEENAGQVGEVVHKEITVEGQKSRANAAVQRAASGKSGEGYIESTSYGSHRVRITLSGVRRSGPKRSKRSSAEADLAQVSRCIDYAEKRALLVRLSKESEREIAWQGVWTGLRGRGVGGGWGRSEHPN